MRVPASLDWQTHPEGFDSIDPKYLNQHGRANFLQQISFTNPLYEKAFPRCLVVNSQTHALIEFLSFLCLVVFLTILLLERSYQAVAKIGLARLRYAKQQ